MQEQHKPAFFVTGGEVGADSIPFECHAELGIGVTGYMPEGFKRSDGRGKEIADKYGLKEGKGSYPWRDEANARSSDALLGFLSTLPLTGRGTMQTASVFIRDFYRRVDKTWEPIAMPKDMDFPHLVYRPTEEEKFPIKPVLIIWDLNESNVDEYAKITRGFLNEFKPRKLMVSGPTASTDPNITKNGADLLRKVFYEGGDDGDDSLSEKDLRFLEKTVEGSEEGEWKSIVVSPRTDE